MTTNNTANNNNNNNNNNNAHVKVGLPTFDETSARWWALVRAAVKAAGAHATAHPEGPDALTLLLGVGTRACPPPWFLHSKGLGRKRWAGLLSFRRWLAYQPSGGDYFSTVMGLTPTDSEVRKALQRWVNSEREEVDNLAP